MCYSQFSIKKGVNIEELTMLTPAMTFLLGAIMQYTYSNNIKCEITSIMEHVDGRRSTTHRDGRAVDISIKHFPNSVAINKMCHYFNVKYKNVAALSASDGVPRACIYHKISGGAYHLHFQTRREKDIVKTKCLAC